MLNTKWNKSIWKCHLLYDYTWQSGKSKTMGTGKQLVVVRGDGDGGITDRRQEFLG